ncbi:D-inositol 3-phosphate glycosyltransferase [alpha proteobacterium Q-1]|nr:D-inositol 3-phosphate glycosyltransferase [alpha proteobacterium Q-1]
MPGTSPSRDLILRSEDTDLQGVCVLQILDDLEPHGVGRSAVDVAKALVQKGGRSVIASGTGSLLAEALVGGSLHEPLSLPRPNPLSMRLMQRRIARLIAAHDVKLVHVRSPAFAWPAMRAAKAAGCHSVSTISDLGPPDGGFLARRYERAFTDADHIIAISDFIAEQIGTERHLSPDRISVIHRGIDLARFNPAAVKAQRLIQLSRRYSLPDGCTIILAAGSLLPRNGFEILIEAMARIKRDDLFCLILGGGPAESQQAAQLEALIEKHKLGGRVRLAGYCEDMPAAYMLADVVAVPSIQPEAFGRVCVEAQAMGRPVVASRHGGARETVLDGETGWLVDPGDAGALAEALLHAADLETEARLAIAMKTRSRMVNRFGRDEMCQQVLARYQRMLAA